MFHRCLKYILVNEAKVSHLDHIAVPGSVECFTMNNVHRDSVEKTYAQPITKDNIASQYDAEALTRQKFEEEKESQSTWFLDYFEPTMMKG